MTRNGQVRSQQRISAVTVTRLRNFILPIAGLLLLSPVLADELALIEPQQIPSSMITSSALDLRGSIPIDVHETGDLIFAVSGICKSPGVINVKQYARSNFERNDIAIQPCGRFAGPSITAIGDDDSRIYIKFGLDSERNDADQSNLVAFNSSGPNVLGLDRTHLPGTRKIPYGKVDGVHRCFWPYDHRLWMPIWGIY
jgi:hypothetical protein